MRVAGIDPGAHGAMCVLDSNNPAYAEVFDLHNTTPYEAADWLFKQQVNKVFIEDVHSLYGMSAKSNFNFGYAVGLVNTISNIVLRGNSPTLVQPKVWQKAVGVTVTGGKFIKQQVFEIALSLYRANLLGKRGALKDGRSDATMLAYYGLYLHKED